VTGYDFSNQDATGLLGVVNRETGQKLPLYVGVNLSAIQVARDDIAGVVAGALKSSGLTGNRLTLELTESAIVQDPARATRVSMRTTGRSVRLRVTMPSWSNGIS